MGVGKTKQDCKLINTDICSYAGSEGCETCYLSLLDIKSDNDLIRESWEATLELIPDDIDDVHLSEKCWLCRGEHKNQADRYAMIELAHKEPIHKKGYFWGLGPKVAMNIGSLLTMPVSSCKQCANHIKMYVRLRWGITILGLVLGIAALFVLASIQQASGMWAGIPYIVAAVLIIAGIAIGPVAANVYRKKKEEVTAMNLFETPILSEMRARGWFSMQQDGNAPRVRFVKKKPRPNLRIKRKKVIDTPVDEVIK